MTDCSLEISVPDWITDHPETRVVFQELGIDCACGGKVAHWAIPDAQPGDVIDVRPEVSP